MFNLRDMSIAKRLTLGFGTIGTAMVISAAVALQGLASLSQGIQSVKSEAQRAAATQEMVNTISEIDLAIYQLVTERSDAGRQAQATQEVAHRVGHTVQGAVASAAATSEMAATTHEIARTAADLAKVAEHLRVQVEAFTL